MRRDARTTWAIEDDVASAGVAIAHATARLAITPGTDRQLTATGFPATRVVIPSQGRRCRRRTDEIGIVKEDKKAGCLFCGRQKIVVENSLAYVTRDTYPVTQGHTLVIPRRHVPSLFDLTTEERLALLELLDRAKRDLDERYRPDGYNIGINDGTAAGQSIMHLHIHLMPRYNGDNADPRGGVRWILPEKAAYWKRKEQGPEGK